MEIQLKIEKRLSAVEKIADHRTIGPRKYLRSAEGKREDKKEKKGGKKERKRKKRGEKEEKNRLEKKLN